jgi:ribose/xylose/arabinose/galactoside ABC-type transport system permease subunit
MAGVRKLSARLWRSYSVAVIVVVLGVVLALLTPRFLMVGNLMNVLTNAAVIAIVGLGMTLAIASGNFDLSVGANAAFSASIAFTLVPLLGVPAGIVAGLLVGALIGLGNGLIITELRVPAFIATLAMSSIVRGATLLYTDGRDMYLQGYPGYKVLSGGHLLGIPMPVILALVIAAVLGWVVQHTRFGRYILAVGSNVNTARRSGVPVNKVIWGIFAIVGACAALSGQIFSAQVVTASARMAVGLELSAIAVVVVGGTALTGGRASLIGTLFGSLLVAMINNGLNLLNVSVLYQQVTIGLLLLVTLAIGVERKYRIVALLRRAA